MIEKYGIHELIENILPEIKSLLQLEHENIVKYNECFWDTTYLYIVNENFSENLESHLKKNSMLENILVIRWSSQLASAIKYLHENHFINLNLNSR